MTKWQLINLCLKQHSKPESNFLMNKWRECWFTFKAIICILLDRDGIKECDTVCIAAWNGRYYRSEDCYNAYEWDSLLVGYDQWRYDLSHDSNC